MELLLLLLLLLVVVLLMRQPQVTWMICSCIKVK